MSEQIDLQWVAGREGGQRILSSETIQKPALALIGHLNFVHPNRVQVLGCAEMDYLRGLDAAALRDAIDHLFSTELAAIVVSNEETIPAALLDAAERTLGRPWKVAKEEEGPPTGAAVTVRVIGEFKGKQDMWNERFPEVLKQRQEVAIIQSTESSNRIEGVTAPPDRLRELMAQKTTPANRSEEEIAGYRDVLATIHASHEHVKVRPGGILQLHRDLYKFSAEPGGHWKQVDNEIADVRPDDPGANVERRRH